MSISSTANATPRTTIRTSLAPAAMGPYSQAVLVDNVLYCSGQVAIDPSEGHLIEGGLDDEADQVLRNLGAVLAAAGMDYEDVVKCTVYVVDMRDYALVNEVYARYFSEEPPARETVEVAALPAGARVEISCIAVR